MFCLKILEFELPIRMLSASYIELI